MTEQHSNDQDPVRINNADADLDNEIAEALGDMSLEDMLESETIAQSSTGSTPGMRTGKVIDVQGDEIFVQLGVKDQGLLNAAQFEDEPLPQVGDEIEVMVVGYDSREGLVKLSRKGAVEHATWESLAKGQVVEGRVTALNTGGLELGINGIRAFMPISQIELHRVEDLKPYINTKIRCQVTEVKRSDKKVVVSRRAVLEAEAQQEREKTMETLAEGDIVEGTVRNIMPYGAFVDIGGVDGLLHVSDMSHARLDDPNSFVQTGQTVRVKVLKIDREKQKISLGMKQVMPDPWEGAETKWREGEVVTGRVVRLADFGAFVELEQGVDGLVPMGELSYERRIRSAGDVVSVGDMIRVRVLSVDTKRKRISLSLKQVGDDPWVGASSRWPVDSTVEGMVTRLADFGAFVELASGVEGLVHISELSDKHVRTPADAVSEGQNVQAKVLEVDEDRRRISLSMKALLMPEVTPEPTQGSKPSQPAKRKKPLKGGIEVPGGWTSLGNLG